MNKVTLVLVLFTLAGCSGDVVDSRIIDKSFEEEKRWWSAKSKCVSRDWDTFMCITTQSWEQEMIDGPDYVFQVLEIYEDDSRKARRVYVDSSTYDNFEPGQEFWREEFEGLVSLNDRHTEGNVRNLQTSTSVMGALVAISSATSSLGSRSRSRSNARYRR